MSYYRRAIKQLHEIVTVYIIQPLFAALFHMAAAFLAAFLNEFAELSFGNEQLVQNALNSVAFIENNKVRLLNNML